MPRRWMAFLVLLAGMLPRGWAGGAPQDDKQKLLGTWAGTCGPLKITLTLTPTEITAVEKGRGDLGAGTSVVDTVKKWLDATRTRGPDAKGTHLGIYQLEGDVLKWCVNRPTQGRPREIRQGPQDGGGWLLVLNRVKTPPARPSP